MKMSEIFVVGYTKDGDKLSSSLEDLMNGYKPNDLRVAYQNDDIANLKLSIDKFGLFVLMELQNEMVAD